MRLSLVVFTLLYACTEEETITTTIPVLPEYPISTDSRFELVGKTGNCDQSIKICSWQYKITKDCKIASLIFYAVRSRYIYAWLVSGREEKAGSWEQTLTKDPDAITDVKSEYADTNWTYYYCSDDEIK